LRDNLIPLMVLAAAIAGLVVGGALVGGYSPQPRVTATAQPIAHEGLRVQVPRGWTRGDGAGIPGFRDPLRLRNRDDGLRANAEQLPATSATLLPAAFLASVEGTPEPPTLVRMAGGQSALRYRVPGRNGSMTLVYAAPNTKGVATVACTGPIGSSVPRACDALGGAVTVPGARPLAPSPTAAFSSRVPAVLSDLDASRTHGLEALEAARSARGQARAADGLGRAHRAAAATLAPLASGDGVPRATVGALTATATAYAVLARAARNRLPGPYADAGRAVTNANADLRKTVAKASAATRTATRAASAPATRVKVAATTRTARAPAKPQPKERSVERAAVEAPAKARPAAAAAAAAGDTDLTLPILALVGAVALSFAIRGALVALRD
jgi:hypothetical protein